MGVVGVVDAQPRSQEPAVRVYSEGRVEPRQLVLPVAPGPSLAAAAVQAAQRAAQGAPDRFV